MTDAVKALIAGPTFMASGGNETYLLFQQGFPLREFCAFEVLDHEAAWTQLQRNYLSPILSAAQAHGHGLLLDALVWRAHPDFISALGYPATDLARFNELAVARMRAAVAAERKRTDVPVLVAGDLGPRGDGYRVASELVTPDAARDYHRAQIEALARAGIDVLLAFTMTSVNESIGVARAAAEAGLPMVISPTVETDGSLPDGSSFGDFVSQVDNATGGAPLFYMINCAHPTHVQATLAAARAEDAGWLSRFKGFRSNASAKSHAELDQSTEIDRGDPNALARAIAGMHRDYGLRIVGGCCGTDAEHIAAIAKAVA